MNHRADTVESKTKWNSSNQREVIKYAEKDSIVNEDRKRIKKKYTQKTQLGIYS